MEAKNDKNFSTVASIQRSGFDVCVASAVLCANEKKSNFSRVRFAAIFFFCPAVQINSIDAFAFGLQTHGEIEKCRKLETVGVIAD